MAEPEPHQNRLFINSLNLNRTKRFGSEPVQFSLVRFKTGSKLNFYFKLDASPTRLCADAPTRQRVNTATHQHVNASMHLCAKASTCQSASTPICQHAGYAHGLLAHSPNHTDPPVCARQCVPTPGTRQARL